MVDNIVFENKHLLLPIVLIGVLLFLVFLWKERDENKKQFLINSVVGLIALISLSLIALKPYIFSKSKPLEIALLTEGYRKTSLDSLQNLNRNLKTKNYIKGETLFNSEEKPTKAYVLGSGIESFDFWQLDNIPATYISGKQLSGITRLKYASKPNVGQSISVKGLFNNPKKGNSLFLVNPSGKSLDSVRFFELNQQKFQLSAKAKLAGNFVYSLVEKDSLNKIVKSNSLPLSIEKRELLKVLIINSFPTFETKYLKNFLAEKNHKVVVRNQISKDRFKYEFFNTVKERLSFTNKTLASFDLLIIDAKSFLSLGNNQRRILKSAIKNEGLGVFIQPETNLFTVRNSISNFKFLSKKQSVFTTHNFLQNFSKYTYAFGRDNFLEAIHQNNSNIYSAYKYLGNGKIGTTVAKETYQLVLLGKLNAYQQFWSDIINALSKKKEQNTQWHTINQFSYKDEPFEFEFQTDIKNPELILDKNQVLLSQDVNNPVSWKGKIYPRSIGWKQLKIKEDSLNTFSLYTFKDKEYKVLNQFETSKLNKQAFLGKNYVSLAITSKKNINLLWFYFIFLISVGYLWIRPKL